MPSIKSCAKTIEAKANNNRVIRVSCLVFILILFMLYVHSLDVIADLIRNLLNVSDTLSHRRLQMFLRNDGKARGHTFPVSSHGGLSENQRIQPQG